jgi:hypothetical protein
VVAVYDPVKEAARMAAAVETQVGTSHLPRRVEMEIACAFHRC